MLNHLAFQISIAVAALAVHVPAEDWGDGGIVNWLRDEMTMHPEYIPGFLELLTVLPEVYLYSHVYTYTRHTCIMHVYQIYPRC